MFPPLCHVVIPFVHDVIHLVDSGDEVLNQLFLAPQFRTGIYGFTNRDQHFLILTVSIVVLFHKHQDIININLYLVNQFHFKDHVIRDIRAFSPFVTPLVS